jgi:hypothetical protein
VESDQRGRSAKRTLATGVLALGLVLAFALVAAPRSDAGHEHPGAPCWSNGFGSGADNNALIHPYIHFTYDYSRCGSYGSTMAVSAWNCSGSCYRAELKTSSGAVFNLHFDYPYATRECAWRAGIEAPNSPASIQHHWHYHHYQCV